MAEFINTKNQKAQRASDAMTEDGMAAFGRPVPSWRRAACFEQMRQMGLTNTNKATGAINRACEAIELDKPYEAMEALTAYLDLTGAYRALAYLCIGDKPRTRRAAQSERIESVG